MARALNGNAVIGQSGGPTAVINQSLAGVIEGLGGAPGVDRILGAHHAVRGIVDDDFIDLSDLPRARLERIAATPSAALGSSRDKPDAEYCDRIVDALARRDVRYFFYIGGNDSSDTCRIVHQTATDRSYDLQAFHIPKTIDNDLMENDHCPGFPSAARFVACAVMGDDLDNRSLPGIKIDVVMGRHAGFLTAASLLARHGDDDGRGDDGDGPHLIYVPETTFDIDAFVGDVDRVYGRLGRCVIAVSEGIHDAEGTPIAVRLSEQVERDPHGNVQLSGTGALGDYLARLVKDRLGQRLRVRADTFGYLQRSFVGCVSEVDQSEARAAGRTAAERALAGEPSGSIAIVRTGDDPYAVEFRTVPLAAVAAKTRTLPARYLGGHGQIDASYREYLRPLVGTLPAVAIV